MGHALTMSVAESVRCGYRWSWWDGEYEGECLLPEGHATYGEPDHWDGMSWCNDDGDLADFDHITRCSPLAGKHVTPHHGGGCVLR